MYLGLYLLQFSEPMGFKNILQKLFVGLLSIASVQAKPSDNHRYAQPATVNRIMYSKKTD